MVKGLERLKINDYPYKYSSQREDIIVEIMKKEQKLFLQLGPKFNYNPKENHELFLSLHSESNLRIVLHFNVLQLNLAYPARHSTDSNDTYEIDMRYGKLKPSSYYYKNSILDFLFDYYCIREHT